VFSLPSLTRNGGQWTEARYNSFIKSAIRAAFNKWGPKWACLKAARVERGIYRCAGYGKKHHRAPASIPALVPKGNKKRQNNIFVDHIIPVGGPGDKDRWNGVIDRLYCEIDGLQVLCKSCHDLKTKEERKNGRERK
jgi:hypothetical protein